MYVIKNNYVIEENNSQEAKYLATKNTLRLLCSRGFYSHYNRKSDDTVLEGKAGAAATTKTIASAEAAAATKYSPGDEQCWPMTLGFRLFTAIWNAEHVLHRLFSFIALRLDMSFIHSFTHSCRTFI